MLYALAFIHPVGCMHGRRYAVSECPLVNIVIGTKIIKFLNPIQFHNVLPLKYSSNCFCSHRCLFKTCSILRYECRIPCSGVVTYIKSLLSGRAETLFPISNTCSFHSQSLMSKQHEKFKEIITEETFDTRKAEEFPSFPIIKINNT